MYSLVFAAVVLPRMATADSLSNGFPLNIVKAPMVQRDTPVMRILQSANQLRKTAAASARTIRIKESILCGKLGVENIDKTQNFKTCCTSVMVSRGIESRSENFVRFSLGSKNSKPSDFKISSNSREAVTVSTSDSCLYCLVGSNGADNRHTLSKSVEADLKHQDGGKSSRCDPFSPTQISKDEQCNTVSRLKHKKVSKKHKKSSTSKKKNGNHINNLNKQIFNKKNNVKRMKVWCSSQNHVIKDNSNGSIIKYPISNSLVFNVQKVHISNTTKKGNLLYLPKVSSPPSKLNGNELSSLQKHLSSQSLNNAINTDKDPVKRNFVYNGEKQKKIYLSTAQSKILISGVPSAPPSTPTQEQLRLVEYIPSLNDIKSQRAVRARLIDIDHKMKMSEKRKKERELKVEQRKAVVLLQQLKEQQRMEIYALNKLMTAMENRNFEKFMQDHQAMSLPV